MTYIEKLCAPLSITFAQGEWDIIRGLLCKQWGDAKSQNLLPYAETCERMMRKIDDAKGRL